MGDGEDRKKDWYLRVCAFVSSNRRGKETRDNKDSVSFLLEKVFVFPPATMSESDKKEFDVKQILRLCWRWFSHPSQGSLNIGSCLQQEGCEQRGTLVQGSLKNHSQHRNGLKKGTSSVHHSILAPVPGQGTFNHRRLQSLHKQNLVEHLPANENTPKAVPQEKFFKEACEKHSQNWDDG